MKILRGSAQVPELLAPFRASGGNVGRTTVLSGIRTSCAVLLVSAGS